MEVIRNKDFVVVPIKLSQEEYENIEDLAACNYTPTQVAMCLDVDPVEFQRQLNDDTSLIYHHFNRGILLSNFEINQKLLDNAKSGNITAVEIFQKRQESVNLHNIKRRILNGGS